MQYSFRGRKVRESSHSEERANAVRLLRRRLEEVGRGRLVGPVSARRQTAASETRVSYRHTEAFLGIASAASPTPSTRVGRGVSRVGKLVFAAALVVASCGKTVWTKPSFTPSELSRHLRV